MRALGLLTAFLASHPAAGPDRPSRPPEPLLPLDEATLLGWRAWARRWRDAAPGASADASRDGFSAGARPRTASTQAVRQD